MSHHFDTPTAREDSRLNLCDFYLFAGTAETTVAAMTVNPAATVDTPSMFRDEALYVFHFDTDADNRDEVSLKVRFEQAQSFEVRCGTGADAGAGWHGQTVLSGATNVIAKGDNGIRAYCGIVNDPFAGDAAALNTFKDALAAGTYRPQAFDNHVNFFGDRTVGGIVIEFPNSLLGGTGLVRAWATVSLFGHAPEQQVQRWGLPLFTHIFLESDELKEAFNRTRPSDDHEAIVSSTIDTVTKYVTLAGTSADPASYGRRVADLFGPLTLPYRPGTTASFDYTGFNGRGLSDNVMDTMLSLLTNSPLGTGIAPDPRRISEHFPYLTSPALD